MKLDPYKPVIRQRLVDFPELSAIRLLEEGGTGRERAMGEIFGPEYLIERPLLQAIRREEQG